MAAFRVNKKIFATIHEDKSFMMVKLSLPDQSVFCAFNKEIIFPPRRIGEAWLYLHQSQESKKEFIYRRSHNGLEKYCLKETGTEIFR